MASEREPHELASVIAHDLINKLTVNVGHSDPLIESTERGTEYARQLTLIRDITESAAKDLIDHRRAIEAKSWVTVPSLGCDSRLGVVLP
jgi:hypothetical protein